MRVRTNIPAQPSAPANSASQPAGRPAPAAIWAAMLTLYIVWGSTYLAIRFAVETLPPFWMAATRFLIPGSILFVLMRLRGVPAPTPRQWRTAAVMGAFLLVGGNGLVTWAEMRIPSGIAALILGATPLWIVLVDAVRPGGVRPGRRTLFGVLLGFAGIVWLIGLPAGAGENRLDPLGAAALALAALSWATGSVFGRERKADLPAPLLSTAMQMLVGGAGLALIGALTGEWNRLDLAAVSRSSWIGLAYLILFGSLAGYSAYTWLLRVAPTPLVATYAYVNPLVAVAVGYLFAAEPLTARILVAAVVIVTSVVLIHTAHPEAKSAGKQTERPKTAPADCVEGAD